MGLNSYLDCRCLNCGNCGSCHVAGLLDAEPEAVLICPACESDLVQSRWGVWAWKGPPVTVEHATLEYREWASAYGRPHRRYREQNNS